MDSTRRGRQVVISAAVVILAAAPALWGGTAAEIIQRAGVQGGLVVHVGCGDGRLTAGLGGSERYVVHGLDTDADNVRRAREHIRSLGSTGGWRPISSTASGCHTSASW